MKEVILWLSSNLNSDLYGYLLAALSLIISAVLAAAGYWAKQELKKRYH